jgi:cytoskeletal protein CcmA (bactofilin family)
MAKQHHLVAMVGSDTVIGTGVEVEGALGSAGDITIDGHVKGDVTADGNITIGVNGEVKGNLSGINIVIAGHITGHVVASGETHLTETCKLKGNITTQLIAIDSGANFLGTIKMQEQQRLLPNDDKE